MAIDFPSSPVNGQTFSASGQTWIYNSSLPAWELDSPFVPGPTGPTGATGATGPAGVWSDAQVINTQSGTTYTVQASDAGKLLSLTNASAITVTINSTLDLSPGQRVDAIQYGTGQVTFAPSGVTLVGSLGLKTRTQWSILTVLCTAADTYIITGDTTV
jgi:hypothetical protein